MNCIFSGMGCNSTELTVLSVTTVKLIVAPLIVPNKQQDYSLFLDKTILKSTINMNKTKKQE